MKSVVVQFLSKNVIQCVEMQGVAVQMLQLSDVLLQVPLLGVVVLHLFLNDVMLQ